MCALSPPAVDVCVRRAHCLFEAPNTIAPRIYCSRRDRKRAIKAYYISSLIRLSSSAPVLNIGWRAGEHRRCHNAVDAIVASRRGMQPPNVKSRHRAEKRTLGEKFLHQVIAKRKATRVYRDC
eukprot:813871-Pyramimonas_sp.AAC.1